MSINKKATPRKTKEAHLNWMGGTSFDISNPVHRLRVAASSCFFGEPKYYEGGGTSRTKAGRGYSSPALSETNLSYLRKTLNAVDPQEWRGLKPSEMIEKAIDAALDHSPEDTLKEAVRLRNEEHMRSTPQVILVRAAHHPNVKGTSLISTYAPQIIKRGDEPAVCLAYQLSTYGRKAIPNSLKRAWRKMIAGLNEYQLAKYRMEGRTVKTVDVVNLVHPKSPAVNKLVRGNLKVTGQTWEALISEKGSNKENWESAIDVMGHMALLRNLRNLSKNDVNPTLYLDKLIKGAETGQQLPFRYYSAYRILEKEGVQGRILDAVEDCLTKSLKNLPHFSGNVMSLCDNSGSAWGTM